MHFDFMHPDLRQYYIRNREKLINAMLARSDRPCRGRGYKSGHMFCTLGLAIDLIIQEFPDKLEWFDPTHGITDLRLIGRKERDDEDYEKIDTAEHILGSWLGMDKFTLEEIIEENDANFILDRPYTEREPLWNS